MLYHLILRYHPQKLEISEDTTTIRAAFKHDVELTRANTEDGRIEIRHVLDDDIIWSKKYRSCMENKVLSIIKICIMEFES